MIPANNHSYSFLPWLFFSFVFQFSISQSNLNKDFNAYTCIYRPTLSQWPIPILYHRDPEYQTFYELRSSQTTKLRNGCNLQFKTPVWTIQQPDQSWSKTYNTAQQIITTSKLIMTQYADHAYDCCWPQIHMYILTTILPLLESESASDTCMMISWLLSGRLCSPRGGFGLKRLTVSSWTISLPTDWPDTNPAVTVVNVNTDKTLQIPTRLERDLGLEGNSRCLHSYIDLSICAPNTSKIKKKSQPWQKENQHMDLRF
jgi:hypothetical protein